MCSVVLTEKVINNNNLVIRVQRQTIRNIKLELMHLFNKNRKLSFKEDHEKKILFRIIAQEIYCALEPMEFSFDFCEINEDIVDFEANLKNDFEPYPSINKDEYEIQVHKLNNSFDLLPEQQRLALLMFYILNMSLSEIAELFNVKEAKAKSIVANARKN